MSRSSKIYHKPLVRGQKGERYKIAEQLTNDIVSTFDTFTRLAKFPAFWISEQRTKTFITHAISKLSKGVVLHEPPATRKGSRSVKKIKNGRADYWFRYKDKFYFLEVKQTWQEMNKKFPSINVTLKRHEQGWNQADSISHTTRDEWDVSDNVMALTIAPFWTTWKKKRKGERNMVELHDFSDLDPEDLLQHILEQMTNSTARLVSLIKLGSRYQGDREWQYWEDKRVNYHYLMMLWSWK